MDLFVKETGKENEESIVFIHGGGVSGWMWDKQLKEFTDYHCLVSDLPEHGKSNDIAPFTMESAAEQVIEIIKDKAHNKRAHIIGISLGGQLVVQILSRAPEVVDHAVIGGTMVRKFWGKTTLNLFMLIVRAFSPIVKTDFAIKQIMKRGIPLEYFEDYKKSINLITYSAYKHIMDANASFRIPPNLYKAKNLVLITLGEKELKPVHESAKDLNKCLSNSKAFMVSDLYHLWNLESPDLFNKTVRAWLNNKELLPGELLKIE